MEIKISKNLQSIAIYRNTPLRDEDPELSASAAKTHGKVMVGNLFICNNALVVKDNDGMILGVFSLDHYYFVKPNLP